MYTNAGLRIQLPILFIWKTDMALAFLESVWPRKLQVRYTHSSKAVSLSSFYVVIPLERTHFGVYRRLQGCMPFYAPESLRQKARSQQIYLQDTADDDRVGQSLLGNPTEAPLVHIDISGMLKEGYRGFNYFPPRAIMLNREKSRLLLRSNMALILFQKDERLPMISLLVTTGPAPHKRPWLMGYKRFVKSGIALIRDNRSPLECLLCSICGTVRSHPGPLHEFQWCEELVLPAAQGSRLLCSKLVLVAGQPTVNLSFYPYPGPSIGDVETPLPSSVLDPWNAVNWD
ncbi:hypothetical protein F4803DRAFT_534837, partial [Xylaria telfairii]